MTGAATGAPVTGAPVTGLAVRGAGVAAIGAPVMGAGVGDAVAGAPVVGGGVGGTVIGAAVTIAVTARSNDTSELVARRLWTETAIVFVPAPVADAGTEKATCSSSDEVRAANVV